MIGKTWKKYIRKHWWKYILGLILVFLTMMPLYVLIEMSLKEPTDLASRLTWPNYIYFDNYIKVLKENNMLNAYKNTLIVTIGTVTVEVFCGCLAAYPLARKQTRFNEFIRSLILAIMMVPAVSVRASTNTQPLPATSPPPPLGAPRVGIGGCIFNFECHSRD